MKPKAPRKVPIVDTAAIIAAWLAVVAAATTPEVEIAAVVIPIAYAAE